jgi:hypothetical protein
VTTTEETTPPEPPSAATEPATPDAPTPPAGDAPGELPDWARKELEKARGDAAAYRTRLREKETELETRVRELTEAKEHAERATLREAVARRHQLPEDLAALLQGQDAEALEAHAKTLAQYVPAPAAGFTGEARGGLDPDGDTGDFDPVAVAQRARRSRR